jgi:hypothetical protein
VSAALTEISTEPPQTALPPRSADSCLLCPPPRDGRAWRRADAGYRTCSDCLDRVRERLAEVGTRYAALNPRPGAQGTDGGPRPPGFGSRSPASDQVVAVRDWRSSRVARTWRGGDGRIHRESQRPPLSVLAELFTLARHVADARGLGGPMRLTVADIARWLDGQLDWVSRQAGVVEFDRVLRELVGQLRPLTGEPRPKRVGECPNVLQIDGAEGEHTRECATPLYAPLKGDEIRCWACGHRWPREEWLRLGKILQVAS